MNEELKKEYKKYQVIEGCYGDMPIKNKETKEEIRDYLDYINGTRFLEIRREVLNRSQFEKDKLKRFPQIF